MLIGQLTTELFRSDQFDFRRVYPVPFIYTPGDIIVAAGATGTGTVTIQTDAAFVWTELRGIALNANTLLTGFGTQQIINATVQINDTGSGENLFSAPVDWNSLCGHGDDTGLVFPSPRIANRNATFTFTITNNDAAQVTFRLSMIGTKLKNRKLGGAL